MKYLKHKKIGSLWNVILQGNDLKITKYNKQTAQFDVEFKKNYGTPRPDLYADLKSVKGIKTFIKKYK